MPTRYPDLVACFVGIISLALVQSVSAGNGQPFVSTVAELSDPDKAEWIGPPPELREESGLYLFRKAFELDAAPEEFVIHLTADPRYRFWVNGAFVTLGPAAGDPLEWHYATLDIAEYLIAGRNLLAVELWDAGPNSGTRQVAIQTGMLLSGPELDGAVLKSDTTWKTLRSDGWSALPMDSESVGGGYIAGATERMVAAKHPWGWQESAAFDDSAWSDAVSLGKGSHGRLDTWLGTPWTLRERPIPLLSVEPAEAGEVRAAWLDGEAIPAPEAWPVAVAPRRAYRILLDRRVVGLGYPRLEVSGGADALVRLRYQEALFRPEGGKGDRDEIAGKVMKGYYDLFEPDGAEGRVYTPAWLRVYRYLEITVETGDEPLVLEGLTFEKAGYPFQRRGGFASSDGSLEAILEASWNTADVCALETYMDCPYYEQVQYVGDTRIQALISLYMTGDDRLMRNAIEQFHRSRQPNGLTTSAYPVGGRGSPQLIPPFSLVYVSMVHDYYMHREDASFVEPLLPGIAFTLEWFLQRVDERGLLGPLPYWNHTDGGARGFHHGSPPGASTGGSIQISLLLVAALDDAADMFEAGGRGWEADRFRKTADRIRVAVNRHGYDAERGLYAETPEKRVFSQHTNAFAILTRTVPEQRRAELAERLVGDAGLVQASLYFQFYIFEALREAGRGELILPQLDRWRAMLAAGLTTFPEHGIESRSDAHAWAAHPLYHLLATTAGIVPREPGFRSVEIRPAPGELDWMEASACHPNGMIHVKMKTDGLADRVFEISLPDSVTGTLVWEGQEYPLDGGNQTIHPR